MSFVINDAFIEGEEGKEMVVHESLSGELEEAESKLTDTKKDIIFSFESLACFTNGQPLTVEMIAEEGLG